MRIPQPPGTRGSLRWVQLAINRHPHLLAAALPGVRWLSPLAADDYAEYRDGSFLRLLGLDALTPALKAFWPTRGPQWDALGLVGTAPVLVEAKAHLREFVSPPTQANGAAREKIAAALAETRAALGVVDGADWMARYYQFTNRLAHLQFLHREGVPATLVFVNFLGDTDMGGPADAAAWEGAYRVAETALGLRPSGPDGSGPGHGAGHALSPFIRHVYIDVRELAG